MTSLFRGPITGPKAFAIFSSFFVVIIAVNVVMACQAVHTFPGLEVENSYVASQTFDAERQAQEALGWTARAAIEEGELVAGPRPGRTARRSRGATVARRAGPRHGADGGPGPGLRLRRSGLARARRRGAGPLGPAARAPWPWTARPSASGST